MIYFDYAASTMLDPEVQASMIKTSDNYYAHPDTDRLSKQVISQISNSIKNDLKASEYELIFTSSGSMANNLAINALASKYSSNKHFITTSYEHNSLLTTFKQIEQLGHSVTYVKPNSSGVIETSEIIKHINQDTVLVSVMGINNELGSVNDINDIFKQVKAINPAIVTHSDMVQSVFKVADFSLDDVDMFSLAAHKFYGPKGIGGFFYKSNLKLEQTAYYEFYKLCLKGTQSTMDIVGFGKAVNLACLKWDERLSIINERRSYLVNNLQAIEFVNFHVLASSNIVSIYLDIAMQGESLVNHFYDNGFKISTKSSCSSKDNSVSNSLQAINVEPMLAAKTVRISISHHTTKDEIDALVSFIKTLKE